MQKYRISEKKALELLNTANLLELGQIAAEVKKELHPEPIATFVIDRNINYTNVCSCKCRFCAFYKDKKDPNAYVLDYQTIKIKIEELIAINGTQLLLQGGLNPDIPLDYYTNLIKNIRNDFPRLTIHAFSPPEIAFIAKINKISAADVIKKLVDAGLSSIPGGGAELLSEKTRTQISPNKISSSEWLDIMRIAHNLGLKTTATMVYGLGESNEEIIEHLSKIRELQDETGGFTAFIPWSFQPNNTALEQKIKHKSTAHDYLKIVAISRIFLDNIKNIQASWVTQGIKTAQLSFCFGANDFGGTMMEENVVSSAGTTHNTNIDEILHYIKDAGFTPVQRNTEYKTLKIFQ